jgi:hypothetical protein
VKALFSIAVLFALGASSVFAGSVSLVSSATVVGTCAAVAPGTTGAADSNPVKVDCSSGTSYAVAMSPVAASSPASGVPATGENSAATMATISY